MEEWLNYLSSNREKYVIELKELLRIPSVSALPDHRNDVRQAAKWIERRLRDAGVDKTGLIETPLHPIVYGTYITGESKPTILFYGHYDVQPADPLDKWTSPPFQPTERQGRIYARGASDMKGNLLALIAACEALLSISEDLPVNIKFLLEGEEEIGSPSLLRAVDENLELFRCDYAFSIDSFQFSEDHPALLVGTKGACGIEVTITTAKSDLHSGLMGGVAANAVHILVQLLDSLIAADGRILVDGFYDDVAPLSEEERQALAEVPDDLSEVVRQSGLKAIMGEPGYSPRERSWARPTLDINGIFGGFVGEGIKTIIPCQASAKITCRLVPNQKPQQVINCLRNHLLQRVPSGVEIEVSPFAIAVEPSLVPAHYPGLASAARTLEAVYGKQPYHLRTGGTLPIPEILYKLLGTHTVGFGFSLADENAHAPNEFFRLDSLLKGAQSYGRLIKDFSAPSQHR